MSLVSLGLFHCFTARKLDYLFSNPLASGKVRCDSWGLLHFWGKIGLPISSPYSDASLHNELQILPGTSGQINYAKPQALNSGWGLGRWMCQVYMLSVLKPEASQRLFGTDSSQKDEKTQEDKESSSNSHIAELIPATGGLALPRSLPLPSTEILLLPVSPPLHTSDFPPHSVYVRMHAHPTSKGQQWHKWIGSDSKARRGD